MAKRIERLINLIQAFSKGNVSDVDKLSERLGVCRRTVFRDMATLRRSGMRVRFDTASNTYKLEKSPPLPPHANDQVANLYLRTALAEQGVDATEYFRDNGKLKEKPRHAVAAYVGAADASTQTSPTINGNHPPSEKRAEIEVIYQAIHLDRHVELSLQISGVSKQISPLKPIGIRKLGADWTIEGILVNSSRTLRVSLKQVLAAREVAIEGDRLLVESESLCWNPPDLEIV